MCIKPTKAFTITLCFYLLLKSAATQNESCYLSRCLDCDRTSAFAVGPTITCGLNNAVHAGWLDSIIVNPVQPPTNDTLIWRCLSMNASPDNATANVYDVIRGCTLEADAEVTCNALHERQRLRGRTNVNCNICAGNLCNGATKDYNRMSVLYIVFAIIAINKYII